MQTRKTTFLQRAWNSARAHPGATTLLLVLLLAAEAGVVALVMQARRARLEAKRAASELWTANLNEARALRTAGGSGARIRSSALLQNLLHRTGLTEGQVISLRNESIAQMALMDVALPTNWIVKASDKPLGWNNTLNLYARDTGSGRVDLFEYPAERVVASFVGPPRGTFDRAIISQDNQFLAVRFSNAGGAVWVWKIDSQELLVQTTASNFEISPDSHTLLLLTPDGITSQSLDREGPVRLLQPARHARKAVFSADSKYLAVLPANRNLVEIWDAGSGATRLSFQMNFNPHQVAWHPNGSHLLMGGSRGQVEMRILAGGIGKDFVSAPVAFSGHVAEVRHITFTPDGSTAISYSWDHSSIAWDVVSGRRLLQEQRVILHGANATGDRVIVRRELPMAESVAEMRPRTGYRTAAWAGTAGATEGVWTSSDGRLGVVNCASQEGQVEGDCLLWDLAQGVELARFKGVWAQFSPDSRTLYTFERYAANRVQRYDVSPKTMANRPASWSEGSLLYAGRRGESVNTGAISADGRTLAVAATDGVIFVDTDSKKIVRSWRAPAHHVVVSQDGKWAATSRHHSPSVLRLAHNGEPVLSLEKYSRVRFSPDSQRMAVVTQDKVQVYELESLRLAYDSIPLEAGSGGTPPVEFSRDGLMFVVPFNRMHVRLYETSSGRELATLSPPNPAPILGSKALEFSADGLSLLAAKNDGETIAWNIPVIRNELSRLGLDWTISSPTKPSVMNTPVTGQRTMPPR